jgi:sugar-specific transcriptional regulator TrmB
MWFCLLYPYRTLYGVLVVKQAVINPSIGARRKHLTYRDAGNTKSVRNKIRPCFRRSQFHLCLELSVYLQISQMFHKLLSAKRTALSPSISPRSINANNMASGEWAYGREPRMASRPYPWMNLDAKSNASRIQSEYHLADELACVKQDVELAQSHIDVTLSV